MSEFFSVLGRGYTNFFGEQARKVHGVGNADRTRYTAYRVIGGLQPRHGLLDAKLGQVLNGRTALTAFANSEQLRP